MSSSFTQLALAAPVLDAVTDIGYEQPSPIQAASIPHLLAGRDLLGTAQTGTGKTAAFALPLLSKLDLSCAKPQILVLTPTRELAIQVAEAFQRYAARMPGFHVLPVYGGQDMRSQLRQLKRGAHVVVGTPGRIMDHLRRGSLILDQLQTVVLDEADEMLRMGFIDDVTWILERTPEQRQIALFSATMPKPIQQVAERYLNNPQEVRIATKTQTVGQIQQHYWTVAGTNKLDALTRILEVEAFDGIIIFVRTKNATVELAQKLEARGHASAALNGDMNQNLRERTVEQLKKGAIDIVVATDVAARGIDVARVSLVINYDIPYDTEAYVHRIGRTGRAGRSGKAILFVAPREKRLLRTIEKTTRQTIQPMELPSREQINQKRTVQFLAEIDETLRTQNLEFFHTLLENYLLEHTLSAEQIAAALAYMAQKDQPILLRENSTKQSSKESLKKSSEPKQKPKKSAKKPRIKMETFRLAVGKKHQVAITDIVGAIANEADIDSAYIGKIRLFDTYSTVDLPAEMPKHVFRHLKNVYVRQQKLLIERYKAPANPKSSGSSKKSRKSKHAD